MRRGQIPDPHLPPTNRAATVTGLVVLLLAVVFSVTHMLQAVDTWISLAGGRHILAHGIDDQDPFAFTSRTSAQASLPPGAPARDRVIARWHPSGWINQNWLSHVVLFAIARSFGLDGLFWFHLVLYLGVAAMLVAALRVLAVRLWLSCVVVAGAIAISRTFIEIRAQDFTNLMVAAALLLLTLAHVRGPRMLWPFVPLLLVWSNLHGGFIYGFMLLAVFVAATALAERQAGGMRVLWTGALVGGLGMAATVLASPFHLANLTHPLVVSVSAEAKRWRIVAEWHPLLSGGVDSYEVWAFIAWLAALAAAGALAMRRPATKGRAVVERAPRPPIAFVGLAAITIAMAFASRRFVPVAAFASAPLLALLAERALAAYPSRAVTGSKVLPALRWGALTVAVLAIGWRLFAAYLAPWPFDASRTSPFDRLAWTHRQPHDACRFLVDNRLSGRIFNSWIDGGFLAWCQQPDAESGRTALQVIIDGRAQGAFPLSSFERYLALREARAPGVTLTGGSEQTAAWVALELKRDGVWLALLREDDVRSGVGRALLARPDWKLAYLDGSRMLLVDTTTPAGRALWTAVLEGTARFPDEASRMLARAYVLLDVGDLANAESGLREAARAYAAAPTAMALQTARRADGFPELRTFLLELNRAALSAFLREETTLRKAHGFLDRNAAALVAARYVAERGEAAERAAARSTAERLERQRIAVWNRSMW